MRQAPGAATNGGQAEGPPDTAPRGQLLIVDDDAGVVALLCEAARELDYEVTGCNSGEQAHAALAQRRYDLLLADLQMPGTNGLDLLEGALAGDPELVAVIMTGHGGVPSAVEAMKLGAIDYVLKPLSLAEIRRTLDRAMEVRRLRQNRTCFRALFEGAHDAIYIVGLDQRILLANGVGARRLGYSQDELLRMTAQQITGPEFAAGVPARLARTQRDGSLVFESAHVRRDGALVPVEISTTVSEYAGQPAVLAIARDITERKQAEAERNSQHERLEALVRMRTADLERANRQLTLQIAEREQAAQALEDAQIQRRCLLNMIVHDLKSPLTGMLADGRFLLQSGIAGEEREAAAAMVCAADIMHRLVLDLLDVDRGEDGALSPRRAPVAVAELLSQCAQAARRRASDSRHTVVTVVAPGAEALSADADLLRRVLDNFLDNALKYAPPGTEIRLEAGPAAEGRVALRVRDQGSGVPRAQRETIFHPAVRLEADGGVHARTSRGLGLAFCRLAVEAHGGRVFVEDNQPRGNIFCAELPR